MVIFLDLEMSPYGISVYRKDTNTGLYVNYTGFVSVTHRTTWISSLVTRTCSSNKLSQELTLIKKFFVKLLRHIKIKVSLILQQRNFLEFTSIFHTMKINLFQLLKSCIRKIKVNCKNDLSVSFKMEFLWNAKYRTSIINQSFVAYKLTCPGSTVGIMWEHCGDYVGTLWGFCENNYVGTLHKK